MPDGASSGGWSELRAHNWPPFAFPGEYRYGMKRWLLARFGQRIADAADARLNADFLDWCGENDDWMAGLSQRDRAMVRQAFIGGYVKGARAVRR